LIEKGGKDLEIVVTSNIAIKEMGNISVIDYSSYLNEEQIISDNAGLMCINMLKRIGIQNILLVGFDGFSMDKRNNYYDSSMIMDVETEQLIQMNEATERKIRQLRTQMRIEFFADSVYQR
jgi:4-hydroxy 2-oxovalerate aldolase